MGENVVKMETKKSEQKVSYDELYTAASQLNAEYQKLQAEYQKLAKAYANREQSNFFARLEWLWRIIESNNTLLTSDFKGACAIEFMGLMTPQEENVESNTEE